MQQLMLLRHAKAVPWRPGVEDFPRALSEAGKAHAARLARWISEHLELPEQILCSPAQRTRETLAPLLALQPELETRTSFVPQIYGASTNTLSKLLHNAFSTGNRVLIVGHNPGFEMLAFDVLAPRQRSRINRLATGTLLVVDFESGWASDANRGILRHAVRGKQL
jgi:phosphohistidine phosphatase SixA